MALPAIPQEYEDELIYGMMAGETLVDKGVKAKKIPGVFNKQSDPVPHEVIEAVVARESEWNKDARNPAPCWTGGHAEGLGQFCSGPEGQPGGGSMEVSDYEAVTGTDVTREDIYNPKKALELVAFGLNDRYARHRKANPNDKDWYKAATGYSPLPGTQGDIDYRQDLFDYVVTYYGEKRAEEIKRGTPGDTDIAGDSGDCADKYGKFDPRRYTCEVQQTIGFLDLVKDNPDDAAAVIGPDVLLGIAGKKFLVYLIAGGILMLGIVLLVKPKPPMMKAAEALT